MHPEKNGAATNNQPFKWSRKHKPYTALLDAQGLWSVQTCAGRRCVQSTRGGGCGAGPGAGPY